MCTNQKKIWFCWLKAKQHDSNQKVQAGKLQLPQASIFAIDKFFHQQIKSTLIPHQMHSVCTKLLLLPKAASRTTSTNSYLRRIIFLKSGPIGMARSQRVYIANLQLCQDSIFVFHIYLTSKSNSTPIQINALTLHQTFGNQLMQLSYQDLQNSYPTPWS